MKIPFTFTKMYNVGSKLECFFPPFVVSNYLLCKHSLASNFINICLPVQIVQGALPRKSWEWTGRMSGSAPLSLIQVRPTSIVSRKSKNTALYFDLPFLNISQYAWRGSQMTGFPSEVFLTTDQKWMWQQHCMKTNVNLKFLSDCHLLPCM